VKRGEALNEVAAFEYIFKKQPDLTKKHALRPLQNLMHDLKKELLDFFAWKEYKENRDQSHALLLRLEALRKKGMTHLYAEQVRQAQKELQNQSAKSPWEIFDKMMVDHHQIYHVTEDVWHEEAEQNLDILIQTLDQFYTATAWKYRVERANQIATYNTTHRQSPADIQLLKTLTNSLAHRESITILYKDLYEMLTQQDQSIFDRLQKEIYIKELSPEERWVWITALINFKVRQKDGNPNKWQEIFDLYDFGLKNELFITSGFLPVMIFNNIVGLASQIKPRSVWVEVFIKKYGKKLPPSKRGNTKNLAMAKWRTEQGKYQPALSILNKIESTDAAEMIQCRLYTIRIYYELNQTKELVTTIERLKQYMRRKEVKPIKKENILDFIKIVTALMQQKNKQSILTIFQQNPHIPMQAWLKKKIDAL
jgi:hypothetical protein